MTPATNPTSLIETIEARMDGRVSSIETTYTEFSKRMDERQKNSDAKFDRIETMLAEMRTSLANLRITIIITGITVILGVAALNATVMSNMIASFESGKNLSTAQAEVKRQTEETAKLLRKIQADLEKTGKK
ncbi:hypothetical protein SAMN05192549_10537 [Duganella sacchari]|uniref:Uncharacterized protein n=1 Tax=Duganella sacchari TaxID=551987 RepID=A0A1M7PGR2_9BURK|nr:hypothetical protein [Duganella sacchari]SHN15988.1 hypothetical protein SAMN05192549_10537 [Duganella sacchari]